MADDLRETARVRALRRYCVLDTAPEPNIDRITALLHRVAEAPMAALALVEERRLFVKSAVGLAVGETPWLHPLCDLAIQAGEPISIEDAGSDPRLADLEGVASEPFVRYFAGAPIVNADGHAIGVLCVLDLEPRRPNAAEWGALVVLARQMMELLELRLQTRIDPQTGLIDRRAMEERLAHELIRVEQDGLPLSLALFDVSRLRQMLEDTGRVARQSVFRTLNQRLHEVAHEGTVTCRSGYDELAVVMPGTSEIDARDRSTAIQSALSALAYGGRDTAHVPAGIAACVQGRHTVGDLVQRAQSALERSRGLPGTPTVIASPPSDLDGTTRR